MSIVFKNADYAQEDDEAEASDPIKELDDLPKVFQIDIGSMPGEDAEIEILTGNGGIRFIMQSDGWEPNIDSDCEPEDEIENQLIDVILANFEAVQVIIPVRYHNLLQDIISSWIGEVPGT